MEKSSFPSDQHSKFMLRLPGGLRDRIKDIAEKNKRSMNAEILATLEQKYPNPLLVMASPRMEKLVEYLLAGKDEAEILARLDEVNSGLESQGARVELLTKDDGTRSFQYTLKWGE